MNRLLYAYCMTNTGNVRPHNEDNFIFNNQYMPMEHQSMNDKMLWQGYTSDRAVFGIFDGMGGEAAGEVASFTAADYVAQHKLTATIQDHMLSQYIQSINDAVVGAKGQGRYNTMGSTLAMLFFEESGVWVANLGDSPIFMIRNGQIQKITVDHTDAEFLKKMGIQKKPSLSQYLGVEQREFTITPSIKYQPIMYEDIFLICSDGLTDMLSEARIYEILSKHFIDEAIEVLVDEALKNGGKDNITIILCQII